MYVQQTNYKPWLYRFSVALVLLLLKPKPKLKSKNKTFSIPKVYQNIKDQVLYCTNHLQLSV